MAARRKFCSRACQAAGYQRNGGDRSRPYKRTGYDHATQQPLYEHRVIAAQILGRKLRPTEVVHHVNGDKKDNRSANFVICTSDYHRWLHHRMSELYMQEHFPRAQEQL